MIDDIFLFIRLSELKTFKALAIAERLSTSTLVRRIKLLEEQLGFQLYSVLKNNIFITDRGQQVIDSFLDVRTRCTALFDNIRQEEIAGEITLVISPALNEALLNSKFNQFVSNYPKLRINIHNSIYNEFGQMREFDLAVIFNTNHTTAYFIQQMITKVKLGLYASQEYINSHKELLSLKQIMKNEFIGYLSANNNQLIEVFNLIDDEHNSIKISVEKFRYRVSSIIYAQILARSGVGIAVLPISEYLNLKQVLPGHKLELQVPIYFIQSNNVKSKKKTLLLDYFRGYFMAENKNYDVNEFYQK